MAFQVPYLSSRRLAEDGSIGSSRRMGARAYSGLTGPEIGSVL